MRDKNEPGVIARAPCLKSDQFENHNYGAFIQVIFVFLYLLAIFFLKNYINQFLDNSRTLKVLKVYPDLINILIKLIHCDMKE